MTSRLLVIGEGPKAMAIAAKATALKRCGYTVPEIVIVEKNHCAANWSGSCGYTDGEQTLGTLPEKDVGFPYFPFFDEHVVEYMAEKFSWQVYLVTNSDGWMDIGEWVDRGRQPPPHKVWARYFNWVKTRVDAVFITGEVRQIGLKGDRWQVDYFDGKRTLSEEADGLVITGPGKSRRIANQPDHPRILNGRTFWAYKGSFDVTKPEIPADPRHICVIGNGETAASILVDLVSRLNPQSHQIFLVNRQGMIFSRGENYFENSIYTSPDKESLWTALTEEHRRTIVKHTDRGVFSLSSLSTINQARNVQMVVGDVTAIDIDQDHMPVVLTNYQGAQRDVPASYVIVAIGFDPWWFQDLFEKNCRDMLLGQKPLGEKELGKIASNIREDLSLPWADPSTHNLPNLHVPMLSGVAQGPGFPNLSCLGTLSDRILKKYFK